MKKILAAMALLSVFNTRTLADQTVAPDARTTVRLSNHDINRLVCPGTLQDMIFSKEKDLTGHFSKNDAFIKFKIKRIGNQEQYATVDNELFLVCDGNVYTIIAQPANIPSTTVRLTPPKGNSFKQNIEQYKNMPLEKRALHIIREAYKENYPSSYTITASKERVAIRPDIEAQLRQYVDVEGIGLRLKLYDVQSVAQSTITLKETDFLRAAISPALLAVAVEDHTLNPHEKTRVFVVEEKGEDRK